MNGRKDEIVFVKERLARAVTCRVRRIEREFGEKTLAARIGRGDLHELQEIGLPHHGIVMDAIEMRLVPAADEIDLGRPAGRTGAHKTKRLDECGPMLGRGRRRLDLAQCGSRIAVPCNAVERLAGRHGTDARHQLDDAEPGDAVARGGAPRPAGAS